MYKISTIFRPEIKTLFQTDPWGSEGPTGPRAKMVFMATYNIDKFRRFVFESSFLELYRFEEDLIEKVREDDVALLKLAAKWLKWVLFKTGDIILNEDKAADRSKE